ncbi:MAG: hypothetical protein GXP04_09290 [Alphaproteobacteria bacterium]|nr:hypothetical protein [Alphaproteobacteria bacterium]
MEKLQVKHSGGCQCGAHRFEIISTPKFACKCHCKSCRKATGAAFSTWVGFKSQQVNWLTKGPSF